MFKQLKRVLIIAIAILLVCSGCSENTTNELLFETDGTSILDDAAYEMFGDYLDGYICALLTSNDLDTNEDCAIDTFPDDCYVDEDPTGELADENNDGTLDCLEDFPDNNGDDVPDVLEDPEYIDETMLAALAAAGLLVDTDLDTVADLVELNYEMDPENVDSDNDGVLDNIDLCPTENISVASSSDTDTIALGTDYDLDGCQAVNDLDDDGDGICDEGVTETDLSVENCVKIILTDECKESRSIIEGGDRCNDGTYTGIIDDYDTDGCDNDEDSDDDNDGVEDDVDACDQGNLDWLSSTSTDNDSDGCEDDSSEDLDDDNDGVCDSNISDDHCVIYTSEGDTGDSNQYNAVLCGDLDEDGCDDCAVTGLLASATTVTSPDSSNDGADYDSDGYCDVGDADDDNDNICDGTETQGTVDDEDCTVSILNEDLCVQGDLGWESTSSTDYDNDGCQDSNEDTDDDFDLREDDIDYCDPDSGVNSDRYWDSSDSDQDFDEDGCQDSDEDSDDDNDSVEDSDDEDAYDPFVCKDDDEDSCDDCSVTGSRKASSPSSPDTTNDGVDYDSDGDCDAGDADDDNDTICDALDTVGTVDDESCTLGVNSVDDCVQGNLDWTSNSSTDYDNDGCQDSDEDADDDNDFREDAIDYCDPDSGLSSDRYWDSSDSDQDFDEDGCQDSDEDNDDDNDSVADSDDQEAYNPFVCEDDDDDSCDDCSVTGSESSAALPSSPDTSNDGTDTDGDGDCDVGDDDDDNDGVSDDADEDALDPLVSEDADEDSCDDCSVTDAC